MKYRHDVSRTSHDRYTVVAMVLHWAIAAFIVLNLITGFFIESWLHGKPLAGPPPFPAGIKPWERQTARFTHFLLYAAMVLMPVTGWAILSAHPPPGSRAAAAGFAAPPASVPAGAPRTVRIWELLPMAEIGPIEAIGKESGGIAPQHLLHEEFAVWHGVGGLLLLGLPILHVLAALKHQFIDRQSVFARLGIGGRRHDREARGNRDS